MKRVVTLLAAAIVGVAMMNQAKAQVAHVTYFAPPVPVTTFFAPAPVVHTSFFAPAPVVAYQPVQVARTRYRPILGGSVTRYRTGFAPVVVQPAPVFLGF